MHLRSMPLLALTCGVALACATDARAVSPRNPYRSFNLSGLNYGSMQWEKAQRQGQPVWRSSNTPAPRDQRGGTFAGGAVTQGSGSSRRSLFRRR
ncbi:MAG: hypothetical protein ACKO1M_02990 [Planctomycetota bacterium]